MAKGYLSNRQKNLRIGISSYTENSTVLEITGKVGIKTDNAQSALDVRGTISIGRTDFAGINSIRSVVDINSWEYGGAFKLVSGEESVPTDIFFNPDGTKMFILGDSGNDVNEYLLSTPWEVSSAGFTINFSVGLQDINPSGLYFKPDGTRMYICGTTGVSPLTGDRVYSYTLDNPWSLVGVTTDTVAGAGTTFKNFNVGANDSTPGGVYFKDDGYKMYVVGAAGDAVYEYTVSTAWEIDSTVTLNYTLLIGATNTQNLPLTLTNPTGIDFNTTGTKMYITDSNRDVVARFDLTIPWDLSTAVFYDNVYVGFQDILPLGIFYQEDQSKAYLVGDSNNIVYQYNTDVPSLELASSGISTRSSIILNNEARLNNRLYVTGDTHISSNTTLKGTLTVDGASTLTGNVTASGTLTVSGGTITAGNVAASLLTGNTTTNVSAFTALTSGTLTIGGTNQTGTMTIDRSTQTHTLDIASAVSGSGNQKTINLGTGGASGSRTLITVGSATAGAISTVTIPSPTNLLLGTTVTTGTASQPLQVTGGAYVSGNLGIGTTNPTSKLDIQGDAKVSGVVTATTFIGALTGTATTATKLETARTFEITGDVVASAIGFDGSGNVSLAATIQPNSVALGSDTTGDYVSTITGTSNQITVTSGTGEGSTPTLSIPSQFTAPQDVTVTRDLQVNRNLNVTGNITIGGTTATIFSSTLNIYDPDIVLGVRTDAFGNDVSTDNTANHGGIAIASTEGTPLISLYDVGVGETNPATYKKFMWFKSGTFSGLGTDAWISNYAIGIGSTQVPNGVRLAAGSVQFTERDLVVVRNINSSGVSTLPTLSGTNATYGTGNFTTGNIVTGFVTTLSGTTATYGTGNFTTGNIVTGVVTTLTSTNATLTNINSSGISTLGVTSTTNLTAQQLNVSGVSTFQDNVYLGDNDSLYFGDGNDLRIVHNGTFSLIQDNGVGDLFIQSNGNSIVLNSTTNESYAKFNNNGAVELYYDNSKEFETTGYGATVFGVLQSQGFLSTDIATISVNSSSDALRINQLGAGNALVVEDETNPDSTPFVINASGNLGVGRTNPSSKLEVLGTIQTYSADTTSVGSFSISNLGLCDITAYKSTGGALRFVTANSSGNNLDRGRVDSSGNFIIGNTSETGTASQPLQVTGGAYVSGFVGIGITNPISILETQEDTTVPTSFTITNSNTGNNITKASRIRFRLTDSVGTRKDVAYITAYPNNLDSSTGDYLSFHTRTLDATPTEKMRLDNNGNLVLGSSFTATGTASQPLQVTGGAYVSGNLGIGNTNPSSRLDVLGDSNLRGTVYLPQNPNGIGFGTTISSPSFAIRQGMGDSDGWQIYGESPNGANTGRLVFEVNDDVDDSERFLFRTRRTYTSIGGTSLLELGQSGNIIQYVPLFIGAATSTGTASQRLQVNGGAYVSTRLGIGQTNPNTALHIGPYNGNDLPHLYLGSGNNLFGWRFDIQDFGGGSVPLRIWRRLNGTDTEVITVLNQNGNVGIGTTNPTSKLDIQGDAKVSGVVTATTFIGALTGTATSTTNIPNLSGDVSSVNTTTTLATVNSNVGTYGDAGAIPRVTVNAKGLVTGVSTVAPNNGTLTLSVSGTGLSGSATFTANQSGNSTFTVTSNATSDNTNNAIVSRNASGGFSAGIITATQFSTGSGTIGIATNTITGPSELIIDPAAVGDNTGLVRIKGDLYVDGTQTIINSSTIELADFNVGIATTVGTNSLLDGAGIGIGATAIRKTLTWNNASTALKSSENFDLASGKSYKINGTDILTSTTLGSSVVNSSLTSVGTLGQLNVSGITTSSRFVSNVATGTAPFTVSSTTVVTNLNADLLDGQQGSYYLDTSSTAQTKSGNLTVDQLITTNNGNSQNVRIGDDIWLGDMNVSNTLRLRGQIDQTQAYIVFGTSNATSLGRNGTGPLTYGGDFVATGNIGIGSTAPTEKLDVIGTVKATDFNTTSDQNLKTNIQTIENPLDKIVQIRGVNFEWKENNKPSAGVIAQEVEKVLPQLVNGEGTKTVNYNGLIGLLIECIKEQQKQIDNLREMFDK